MSLDLNIEEVQSDFTLKALVIITMPIHNYRRGGMSTIKSKCDSFCTLPCILMAY